MKRAITKTGLQIIGISLAVSLMAGCTVDLEGEEGNFTFRYLDSEGSVAEDLAVGASVDVEVLEVDNEVVLDLDEVYSEAGDVIEVADQQPQHFQLDAISAGTARITAEAEAHGEDLSDTVELRAAEAAELEIENSCSEAVFLTDGGARFRYKMRDASGGLLTGYGHYPVSLDPEEGGTVDEDFRNLGALQIDTGSDVGTYEVVSDLGSNSVSFDLIEAADVTEIDLVSDHEDTVHSVDVGEREAVAAFGLGTGDGSVCGPFGGNVEVTSDSPEICEAEQGLFFDALDVPSLSAVFVEGLEAGDCEVTLSVPDAGLTETFQVEIL